MFARVVKPGVLVSVLTWSLPCWAGGAGANLLVNGDAEAHRCTEDWTAQSPAPGWRVVRGAASALCYSAFASTGVAPKLPADDSPGRALFAAPGVDSAMEQTVDVGPAAATIDRGSVVYQLSGWLGGGSDRVSSAVVTAVFLNERGTSVGMPAVLSDFDANPHREEAGLEAEHTSGPVPVGTRKIVVTVDFPSGVVSFQNAFADNIELRLVGTEKELSPAPLEAPSTRDVPALDHVYVVMMENTNYADVVHGDGHALRIDGHMPFLASLAQSGVILSDMWATYHPSDQNYVAMVAGDTYRYGPVYYPSYDLPVTHLGDLLDAHGKSWETYVQHMNTPCNLVADTNGWYAPDDAPFAQFDDVIRSPDRCRAKLRDLKDFESAVQRGELPDFAWIAADGWWDGEGAWMDDFDVGVSLAKQDAFLQSTFDSLLESWNWRHSRSLLIVTWDESDGWGWPDNHVPTVVVGSPSLLREGQVVDTHYDGYGVLRTVESALGVGGFSRFDAFARPLGDIFSSPDDASCPEELALRPTEAAATRGSLQDTFGRATVPIAVTQGESVDLLGPANSSGAVVVAPLGRAPTQAAGAAIASSGLASLPTSQLAPGIYGAWLTLDNAPPGHAPLPFTVLPRPEVTPAALGVEIRGAVGGQPISVREGANVIVHYCRPEGSASKSWIGVFPQGTPAFQLTRSNANQIGYWLKTPGSSRARLCGEATAYTSELPPSAQYEIVLMKDDASGTGRPVGLRAHFDLTPTLP